MAETESRNNDSAPVWVEIDIDRFLNNLRIVREQLPADCEIILVLKSDAYGHGMLALAKAAREAGFRGRIGIGKNEDARALRTAGFNNRLIKLVPSLPGELQESVELDIEEIVSDLPTVEALGRFARKANTTAAIHLAVDTGMGREGMVADSQVVEQFARAAGIPGTRTLGLMTHFPSADEEDKTFSQGQFERFKHIKKELAARGVDVPLCHVANSAAMLDLPECCLKGVRLGLILYGMYPSIFNRRLEGIEPVMSLHTRITLIRTLPKGWSVGYKRSYKTPEEKIVGTLPVGYYDGYFRSLSNKAEVLVRGRRVPVVGVVSMNMVTVDLSAVPDAQVGDEVVLFGRQGDAEIATEEVAKWAGTISYEITTRVGRSNHRIFRSRNRTCGSSVNMVDES